jgi:diguanylate cyclase (GGDEF)-like protein
MKRLAEFFEKLPKGVIMLLAMLMVMALSLVDYATKDLSLLIFDIVPLVFVVWFAGRGAGVLLSLVGAAFWLAVDFIDNSHHAFPFTHYWNVSIKAAFFIAAAYVVWELRSALERERGLARTDGLTGAYNVRAFRELAEAEIERSRRYHHELTFLYMDIDDFKSVNDRSGHSAGDALLRKAAVSMRKNSRKVDIVARLGGDEFGILMPETSETGAKVAVARLSNAMTEALRNRRLPVTFSIGALTCQSAPKSVDDLMKHADALMYEAKNSGKDRIRFGVCK